MSTNQPNTRVRKLVVWLVILVPLGCLAWPWVQLLVGTAIGNQRMKQYLEADQIIRAVEAFADAHEGRYPTYSNAQEATNNIDQYLALQAAKADDEGHSYSTLPELEKISRRAVWNRSLSGTKPNAMIGLHDVPSPWVFYFSRSDDRKVIVFANGLVSTRSPEGMKSVVESPAPIPTVVP